MITKRRHPACKRRQRALPRAGRQITRRARRPSRPRLSVCNPQLHTAIRIHGRMQRQVAKLPDQARAISYLAGSRTALRGFGRFLDVIPTVNSAQEASQ